MIVSWWVLAPANIWWGGGGGEDTGSVVIIIYPKTKWLLYCILSFGIKTLMVYHVHINSFF